MKYCPICTTDFTETEDRCPHDGARLIDKDQWAPATVIRNKYRILSCIGRGGMGVVYKAEHLVFKDLWALKVMNPRLSSEPEFVRRFYFEAEKQRKLKHPNVVRVDDVDQAEDGKLFIGMEYIDGMPLRDMMQAAQGPLSVGLAVSITRGVAAALEAADALGVVHRDIKPDNILLERSAGGGFIPKLTDFGVAKLREGSATLSKAPMLTPQYAAPEQWQPQLDQPLSGRTDLYALGMTFYEMVAGRLPFQASQDREWMYAHLNQAPPPPSHFNAVLAGTPGLDETILHLLAKDCAARTGSAQELMRELTLLEMPAAVARVPTPAWAEPTRRISTTPPAATPAAAPARISSHAMAPTRPTTTGPALRRVPSRFRESDSPAEPAAEAAAAAGAAEETPAPSRRRGFWVGAALVLLAAGGAGYRYQSQILAVFSPAATSTSTAAVTEPAAAAAPTPTRAAVHSPAPAARTSTPEASENTAADHSPEPGPTGGETARPAAPPTEPYPHALTGHSDAVSALAFSPRGLHLASGGDDQNIKLWELSSDTSRTLAGDAYIHSIAYSPDGRQLAAGNSSNEVAVWDVAGDKLLHRLDGHQDQVEAVAFNPVNGRMLASGSDDKTVRVWNLATQAATPTLNASAGVEAIAFSADGRMLAAGADDQSVVVWQVGSWSVLTPPGLSGPGIVRSVAFDPKGRWLAAGGGDSTIRVWDVGTWSAATPALRGHRNLVMALAFSPDGRWLASGSGDSTVRLWDTSSWSLYTTLSGPGGGVRAVAFSPDGRILAAAGGDHTIRLWRRPGS